MDVIVFVGVFFVAFGAQVAVLALWDAWDRALDRRAIRDSLRRWERAA